MRILLVLLLAACHKPHNPPPTKNPHGEGIDRQMGALKAMLSAPAGATPCESAWNAFSAADEAGRKPGATRLVLRLAPREEFLQRCNALPAAAQPCLVPSLRRAEECKQVKPPDEVLAAMVEIKLPAGAQAGERDADQQFMSTSKH